MADKVNTQSVFTDKTFITLDTLTYFWGKTKAHVDNLVTPISTDVAALKGTVGDATTGLIKEVASLRADVTALGSGEGGIQAMIDNSIDALKLAETYEAKGDAAKAEAAAKSYADSLATNYDAAGTAAGLDAAMNTRVAKLEAINHEQIAADAAATAVAGVIDGAPESFNTLKEVAAWIVDNDHASDVADLMTDVENLKKIDHDAYKGADESVLASAKSYADGLASNYDAAGAAETAKTEAIADAEGKYQPKGNYEAAGTADAKIAALKLSENYDAKGSANTAKAEAIAQAKTDAAELLKGYYTKGEVDNLLTTNSTGDRAYAKQYTDELFGSFQFAANSDIDAIFTKVE